MRPCRVRRRHRPALPRWRRRGPISAAGPACRKRTTSILALDHEILPVSSTSYSAVIRRSGNSARWTLSRGRPRSAGARARGRGLSGSGDRRRCGASSPEHALDRVAVDHDAAGDQLPAQRIVAAAAGAEIEQTAGDRGIVDDPGLLVLEPIPAAFAAAVAERFPFVAGWLLERKAPPEIGAQAGAVDRVAFHVTDMPEILGSKGERSAGR